MNPSTIPPWKNVSGGGVSPSIADLVMDRLDQVDIKTIEGALHGKMNA